MIVKPARKQPHRLKAGTKVRIRGRVRILETPIFDIAGGWILNKPVDGFRCWHEQAMEVISRPAEKEL